MTLEHVEPNYLGIFLWLFILTVLEVVVFYLHLPHPLMIAALVVLAVTKAVLVAMFFMHLKFEPTKLVVMVLSPLILIAVLVLTLVVDLHSIL